MSITPTNTRQLLSMGEKLMSSTNNQPLSTEGKLVSKTEQKLEDLIIKLLEEKKIEQSYLLFLVNNTCKSFIYIGNKLYDSFNYLKSYLPYSRYTTDKLIEELYLKLGEASNSIYNVHDYSTLQDDKIHHPYY